MNKNIQHLEKEWLELKEGVNKGNHPFHTFSFCTIINNIPSARTVVLRNVKKQNNIISFHTDIRSKKYNELQKNNNICALFYDKKRKIQLRLNGKTQIEYKSKLSEKSWDLMTKESKICYLAPIAPSTVIPKFSPNLPSILPHQITKKDEQFGYNNFCLINIKISIIDWLKLDYKGHKRILFKLGKNFKSNWITP